MTSNNLTIRSSLNRFAIFTRMTSCAALLCLAPLSISAQGLFEPVARVNDSAVTRFELDQRVKLLSILGGGTSRDEALEALIEDRIKTSSASAVNIVPSQEDVDLAIGEFASRGSLSPEGLIEMLARNDVSRETLRDFISVSLAWRDYTRARFVRRISISESDIDRALQENGPTGGLLVSMSEIFLPARNPQERAASERLAETISQTQTIAAFAAAARQYSVSASREQSGRLDDAPIGSLPGVLRSVARTLKPGEISPLLSTQNAVGIFQLRRLSEIEAPTPVPTSIKYAAYYIAGGRSDSGLKAAQKLRSQVDTCDDLYGIAKKQPVETLEIDTLALDDIPVDVATQLAQLDPGESSTALTRANGQTLVFLMLCERNFEDTEATDRDAVRTQLQNREIVSLADNLLSELRADANVVIK